MCLYCTTPQPECPNREGERGRRRVQALQNKSQRRQLPALEFSEPYTARPYFGTQPYRIPEFVNKDGLDHGGRKHLDIVSDANMKIALQGLGFIPLSSGSEFRI